MPQEMKRNLLERKKEWKEGTAKTLHKIMNLNKSQKKSTKPFFFKWPIFKIIVIWIIQLLFMKMDTLFTNLIKVVYRNRWMILQIVATCVIQQTIKQT